MFLWIVTQSLRQPALVCALVATLSLLGAVAAARLPVDVLPDLNKPTVTVMTEAEGLSPPEVERLATWPIETQLNGLPGVTRLRSVSGVGLSIVSVELDWGADLRQSRQQIAERLALLRDRLPPGITPQMGPPASIMGQILMIGVAIPDGTSPLAARDLAESQLRPRLLSIPGVAQVIALGGGLRQVRVAPDPVAAAALGVTPEQIDAAARAFGRDVGGGFLAQGSQEFGLRLIGEAARLDALAATSVATRDGAVIRLGDVARIETAARPPRGDGGAMGRPAVILSIEKQPETDTLRLTQAVEAALAEMRPSLPQGLNADLVLFRQADFISAAIDGLRWVLVEAALAVALTLMLLLLHWRATLITLTAIPVSILISVLVFHALGLSINTMTLGGLAIAVGELVDDAVVDVENIFRRLRENARAATPRPRWEVVAAASQEVRSGVVYATAIIVLAFAPLFALSGMEGRLFTALGQAYVVSILCSLAAAVTLTPILAYWAGGAEERAGARAAASSADADVDPAAIRWLKRGYARLILWSCGRLGLLASGAAAAALAAGWIAAATPKLFLPPFNEGSFTVTALLEPGVSLAESQRVGLIAERLILDIPDVAAVGRRTGRAELDEHAEGVHASEIDVRLTPAGTRRRAAIAEEIRSRLAILPLSVNVGQPISHRLDHMLSGVRAQLAVKLFGDDLDALRDYAETLRDRMAEIPGLVDLQVEKQTRTPLVEIAPDPERAALFGLSPAAVIEQAAAWSNGRVVSELVEGARRIDVVTRLDDAQRDAAALPDLLIATPQGWAPLGWLATIRESDGPNQIQREGGRRRLALYGNVAPEADVGAVAERMRAVAAAAAPPPGVTWRMEGVHEAQQQATRQVAWLGSAALLLIIALLYSRYQSLALALIVLSGLPLALVGALAALWWAGLPLSVASMIGFVTLIGIAARNGVLKVSHYLNLALRDGVPFGPALVLRGGLERMTPVLTTAFAAGIGLTPLLLAADAPGKEILHPVAVTIVGGLLGATLLDAALTPALFLRFGRRPLERLRERQDHAQSAELY